jgi:hypothetical protein
MLQNDATQWLELGYIRFWFDSYYVSKTEKTRCIIGRNAVSKGCRIMCLMKAWILKIEAQLTQRTRSTCQPINSLAQLPGEVKFSFIESLKWAELTSCSSSNCCQYVNLVPVLQLINSRKQNPSPEANRTLSWSRYSRHCMEPGRS